jgi:hypothetical protein
MVYWDSNLEPCGTDKLTFDGADFTLASGTAIKAAAGLIFGVGANAEVRFRTDGNARGIWAIDLQSYATAATQVASGNYSVAIGGSSSASDIGTVSIGWSNVVSNDYAVAIGTTNTASSVNSTAIGRSNTCSGGGMSTCIGYSNEASEIGAICIGYDNEAIAQMSLAAGYLTSATLYGQHAHSAGQVAAKGDRQLSELIARKNTTDATVTTLYLNGSSSVMIIPENTVWGFHIAVNGRQTNDDFSTARYVIEGIIKRDTGGNATLVNQATIYSYEDDAAWDVTVDAYTTNQSLRIRVTGAASNNISWLARVELEQITG